MKQLAKLLSLIAMLCIICACFTACEIHTHEYQYSVTKEATCEFSGISYGYCSCGKTDEKVIPALGHTFKNDVCSVCGFNRLSDHVHTVVIDEGLPATCESIGLTEGSHCSACNMIITKQEVIPAIGHLFMKYTFDNNATCQQDGTKTAVCDREGCNVTDTRVAKGTKTEHQYNSTTVAPTCVAKGYTLYLCACGDSYIGDYVNTIAHVYNQEVAEAAYLKAEASAGGNTQYWKSCECGKPSTTEYFEIQKKEGKVTGIQDLSKTYDKQPVLEPTFHRNNKNGVVTVEWYQGENKLDSAPVNAGTYTVKVIVAESATYYEASAEKEFTIAQKEISVLPAITKVYDGTKAFTLTLNGTNGAVEGDEITCSLTVNRKDVKSQNNAVVAWENEAITSLEYENVNYNITATQITVTITPIDLDVTGISFVKEYDGTNYIEREFSGLLTGETLTLRIIMTSEAVGTKGAENVTTHFFGGSAEAKNYTFGGLSSSEYIEAMKAQAEIKAASN